MLLPKVVYVVWEDACDRDEGGWAPADLPATYEPVLMHSVGFVVHDSEAGLILTGTVNPSCFGIRTQIPRGMIRSIKILQKEGTEELT
jgi:hypothetical protein